VTTGQASINRAHKEKHVSTKVTKAYVALQSRLIEAGDERGEVSTEILYVAGIAIALIGVVAAIQAGLMGKVGQIFGG
jgi:hypothetical protein